MDECVVGGNVKTWNGKINFVVLTCSARSQFHASPLGRAPIRTSPIGRPSDMLSTMPEMFIYLFSICRFALLLFFATSARITALVPWFQLYYVYCCAIVVSMWRRGKWRHRKSVLPANEAKIITRRKSSRQERGPVRAMRGARDGECEKRTRRLSAGQLARSFLRRTERPIEVAVVVVYFFSEWHFLYPPMHEINLNFKWIYTNFDGICDD